MSILERYKPLSESELSRLETEISTERDHRRRQTDTERLAALIEEGAVVAITCLQCEGEILVQDQHGNDETCQHCDKGVMHVVSAQAKDRWNEISRLRGIFYG